MQQLESTSALTSNLVIFLAVKQRVVSSAYCMSLAFWIDDSKLLMYVRNNTGPSPDPGRRP